MPLQVSWEFQMLETSNVKKIKISREAPQPTQSKPLNFGLLTGTSFFEFSVPGFLSRFYTVLDVCWSVILTCPVFCFLLSTCVATFNAHYILKCLNTFWWFIWTFEGCEVSQIHGHRNRLFSGRNSSEILLVLFLAVRKMLGVHFSSDRKRFKAIFHWIKSRE